MAWDAESITGPDGQDWRVPVSELESRQKALSSEITTKGIDKIEINAHVDVYWV